ncbi:MAG: DNA mismatch repair endonuclease MutL [Polyangiaceae bacterium]
MSQVSPPQPSIVRVLPADLANKIAAGEVVERPASVVKELVENAIDAGATRIEVNVEAGGVGLVSVTDDGSGMSREDVALAVERHATSKIGRVEDLHAIGTFGFRGEALPSIASVSRFRIVTKRHHDLEATSVVIDGGGPADVTIAGAPPGTQVDVRDLFFNVPARRKFLRALPTESAHITEVVEAIALSHPDVTIALARDGRLVRSYLRASTRRGARARRVWRRGARAVHGDARPSRSKRSSRSRSARGAGPDRSRCS